MAAAYKGVVYVHYIALRSTGVQVSSVKLHAAQYKRRSMARPFKMSPNKWTTQLHRMIAKAKLA